MRRAHLQQGSQQGRHRGVAAVEFAFLLLFLIPIAFGATEFGRALYQYNTLVKATRDGARVLASGVGAEKLAEARCVTLYGNPSCSGALLLDDLDTAGLFTAEYGKTLTHGTMTITTATVTINGYPFQSMVPNVIKNITFGPISTTMRQEES